MKRKHDDLLKLAFGELDADAARVLEAQADASDRAEIEAFRNLHRGLQHLPPPPPDSLSPERLRAAILDRELTARRPSGFAWGWAPLALAGFAFVVLFPRFRPHFEPQVVSGSSVALIDAPKDPVFKALKPLEAYTAKREPTEAPSTVRSRSAEAPKVARVRRLRRHMPSTEVPAPAHDPRDLVAANFPSGVQTEAFGSSPITVNRSTPSTVQPPQTIAPVPSSVVEGVPGGKGGTETVVIASTKRDLETGALAATEKEVSSVLVGG